MKTKVILFIFVKINKLVAAAAVPYSRENGERPVLEAAAAAINEPRSRRCAVRSSSSSSCHREALWVNTRAREFTSRPG